MPTGIPKEWIINDDTKFFEDPTHDERLEDGTVVGVKVVDGQKRYLSRVVTDLNIMESAPPFGDNFPVFPKSDWSAMIKEKKEKKTRVRDFQNFKAHDQDGIPTCWANGPAHAMTTKRAIMGLPYKEISSNSMAVPISGGRVGGYEWEAGQYSIKHGCATVDVWPNNALDRSLNSKPEVIESRKRNQAYAIYRLSNDAEFMSALLMDPPMPIAVAFNRWSHVISGGDGVEVESGAFGIEWRNNWGEGYGYKNDFGFGGYVTFQFGGWSPSSGFCYGPITPSI